MNVEDEHLKQLVEDAVSHALEHAVEGMTHKVLTEAFTAMGFDVSTPEKLIQVQVDMAHLRRQRVASEQIGGLVKKTAIVIVIGGILSTLWVGLQNAAQSVGGG